MYEHTILQSKLHVQVGAYEKLHDKGYVHSYYYRKIFEYFFTSLQGPRHIICMLLFLNHVFFC